jgi:predicted nuclease of restriction endonuclease-like (RecB) superfamily
MPHSALKHQPESLFSEIKSLIEESRKQVAFTVNAALTMLYWNVGKRIKEELLNNQRATYGEQIIHNLSVELTKLYGKGWSEQHLRHCLRSAETFPEENFSAVSRELTWTHIRTIMYLESEIKREFYIEMCQMEKWSTRTLSNKINSLLFERTAISKKPEQVIFHELKELRNEGKLSPEMVFRDPYFLDFLGLKDTYSEKDLEQAILHELEKFILEIGQGFTFVERQRRMVIDNEDHYLDLLFYHRKLKRLVAIDLKLGKFKASYKGQMELYLRYLEKHDKEQGEESPLGLILCSEKSPEQIELLKLEESGIKVAEYLTQLPSKKLLEEKIAHAIEVAKIQIENMHDNE